MISNGNVVHTICIDGPGGSGKTTLAEELIKSAGFNPSTQLIHSDWYFERWPEGQVSANSNVPGFFNDIRFMEDIGEPLNQGRECNVREYRFLPNGGSELVNRTAPRPDQLIVVEGIKLLELPIEWDVKVWVDTPRDVRRERFMARTSAQRKSESLDDPALRLQAFNHWADDAETYEREINPEGREDVLVISGLATALVQIAAIKDFAAQKC